MITWQQFIIIVHTIIMHNTWLCAIQVSLAHGCWSMIWGVNYLKWGSFRFQVYVSVIYKFLSIYLSIYSFLFCYFLCSILFSILFSVLFSILFYSILSIYIYRYTHSLYNAVSWRIQFANMNQIHKSRIGRAVVIELTLHVGPGRPGGTWNWRIDLECWQEVL